MKHSKHVKDGWFFETCPMWPGMALSLEIQNILYDEKSQFQHIQVFETRHHGKMLALDGIIQLTQSDEFSYQEMLAHVPLFAHPQPETVLVIGGGMAAFCGRWAGTPVSRPWISVKSMRW
jgi:spermidine synthase